MALQNIEYEEEKFIVPITIRHRMNKFFYFPINFDRRTACSFNGKREIYYGKINNVL